MWLPYLLLFRMYVHYAVYMYVERNLDKHDLLPTDNQSVKTEKIVNPICEEYNNRKQNTIVKKRTIIHKAAEREWRAYKVGDKTSYFHH